ncbi:response regulator [Flavobacterium sp. MAH-1]|uniref:histidine kinase n=1 Tax=Flavobacterium agri TaxID=2743471 RepID=A0A7Y8Y114_9FLAO|nr:response regulator [Flavobacterium agri]NUY80451.1 response regulator [Flavobacterium agri]NYA70476.1 response regulator [Flavobacterium agri]
MEEIIQNTVKILIVDDKKENLLSLQVILSDQGYEFVEAHSGKDALRILLKDQNFAIILMDVQMPMMDGFETAELIRQSDKLKHVPIIFLTANMDTSDYIFKGYQAGAVDYMIKPLSPEILKAKVMVFADLHRKNLELRIKEEETKQLNTIISEANRELKEKYVEIEEFANELKLKNAELDAFAYVSSHDLQEPLRKIQTFTKLILDTENDNLPEGAKAKLGRILNSADRMRDLITSLLTFSRMSVKERIFERVTIESIIEEVRTMLDGSFDGKELVIETQLEGEINVIPFQFTQLFQNLISNSIKFSKPGLAPHIIISQKVVKGVDTGMERLEPQSAYSCITFQDNGIGFEPRHNEKIFGVFQKLHEKTAYEGTGIGLAIVKKIIENHNGIITAHGSPMKGCTFNIFIPH